MNVVYDHDPDVVRWGLHNLIDVCSLSNAGSHCSITRYDEDASRVSYARECYNESALANYVENDAIIARALQEEYSRIAAAEEFRQVHCSEQDAVLAQNWCEPSGTPGMQHKNYWNLLDDQSKNDVVINHFCNKEADDSSQKKNSENEEISIPISSSNDGEKPFMELSYFLDIADESSLDGEMGKRLNHMVPVPHVPKINGQFPSEDEQISDHQRLLERLKVYDLVENKVQGDGNCQFRALSDQLYRSPDHHKFVRERVVNQLKYHPEMYDGYVPMAYAEYLRKMNKSGEWGDHVTLQAAADAYGVKIFVLTSFKDTCYIEILPHIQISERVIFLSFWAEVHYNSIYPEGEVQLETKKKKKWWMLGG